MATPLSSLLPNAQQQFLDGNGEPLAAGTVTFYVPNTTTPKTVWGDEGETTVLGNVVDLDGAGRPQDSGGSACGIYGSGQYRQIVKDSSGNTIWDQLTRDWTSSIPEIPPGSIMTATATGGGSAQTLTVIEGTVPTGYEDYQYYSFVSAGTSTGLVTLQVEDFGYLPVFLPDGVTQANANALVVGQMYLVAYNSALAGASGGFQFQGVPGNFGQVSGVPSLYQATSLGNAIPSWSMFGINLESGQSAIWENGISLQFTNSTGHGTAGAYKVGMYIAIQAEDANAGDQWALNIVSILLPGAVPNAAHQGMELDIANQSGTNFNDSISVFNVPALIGLQITGVGDRAGAAITVQGGSLFWNRGIAFLNNSTRLASIVDYNTANVAFELRGTNIYGIDGNAGTFTTGFLRMGNQDKVLARNFADGADLTLMTLGANDALYLGVPVGLSGIYAGASLLPNSDNLYGLGNSLGRWTDVWAVNGTIQTSDPRLKTDIQDLPEALPIVMALAPRRWRWEVGGQVEAEVESPGLVPVYEMVEEPDLRIEIVDGVPVRAGKTVSVRVPVMDEIQVVDKDGKPVMYVVPAVNELRDRDGKVIREAAPAYEAPLMHGVPRMVPGMVKNTVLAPKPGKRIHWGFMAPEVKTAFGDQDFGGYVRAEDGTEALRPDQLLSVLWKAVQELATAVAELKVGGKPSPSPEPVAGATA